MMSKWDISTYNEDQILKCAPTEIFIFIFQRMQCQKKKDHVWGRTGHFTELQDSSRVDPNKWLQCCTRPDCSPDSSTVLLCPAELSCVSVRPPIPACQGVLQHGGRGNSKKTAGDWRQVCTNAQVPCPTLQEAACKPNFMDKLLKNSRNSFTNCLSGWLENQF